MNRKLKIKYKTQYQQKELDNQLKKAEDAYERLKSDEYYMTGWIDYPAEITNELISQINDTAAFIRNNYSALIIVGIGGSYLGAEAAIDFVEADNDEDCPKIFFAGINLSSDYHEDIIKQIEHDDTALLIISKSGTTTEPLIAGNFFTQYLKDKYGEEDAKHRIFIVTDSEKGSLRKEADNKGYKSFSIPADIGGRFSTLTPVGLLPMAVAGIDIYEVIKGSRSSMSEEFLGKARELAAYRNLFEDTDYSVELFACFDPFLTNLIQWIRQLYGESEGKDGKGMFPVDLEYSEDLHSMGQFIQEGRQIFSETIISAKSSEEGTTIPTSWGISDKEVTVSELNYKAMEGVISAHYKSGIPIMHIELPDRSGYAFGQILYLLQTSCAIRCIMMGVDPFSQPGVERYKEEIRKSLKSR